MARTLFLLIAGFVMTACVAPTFAADRGRPNIMVILCDDLGYGDLACYGHPAIKTPNLDKLASQGIRLTDCYASAPVCSSSRAGLMTGRTPNRTGVYDWIPEDHVVHLKPTEITVAKLLKDAGYATMHAGKWHLNGRFNSSEQPQPGDHGFDHWFSTQNNAIPTHENPVNFVRNGEAVGPTQGYSSHVVAEETINWLTGGRDKTKPFFAFVCFHEPHEPVASPADLVAQYPGAQKRGEADYYANVTNMDGAVGKLMAALDDMNLAENTLVFFTSDNGPETLSRYPGAWRSHGSAAPLRDMKLHVYEGGIRVPGILRWPARIKAGQVSNEPVCGVDVLPTACELAGVPAPHDRKLDGASVTPIFDGRKIERKQPLFWWYYRAMTPPRAALREGDWKVLGEWDLPAIGESRAPNHAGRNVNPESQALVKNSRLVKFELYNLRDDIGETRDLSSAEPQRLAQMKQKLQQIYQDVQNEAPEWDVPPEAPAKAPAKRK